jgi:miniconductance mechanosensitive channel
MTFLGINEYKYSDYLHEILYQVYVPNLWIPTLRDMILLTSLFVICMLSFYISRFIIRKIVFAIISKTKNSWDDKLFSNKFFSRLAYIIPATIVIKTLPFVLPYSQGWIGFIVALTNIYIIVVILFAIFALLNSFSEVYDTWEMAKYKPIKGYLQLIKIIFSLISVILVISIIFGQSPIYLLTGLGALSAVLLLVFKDALLGLVAGIQLSANDMARPGDWITMPKYNADGDVEEISLTTVKVRNFDRTLVYIPSYAMISDSFVNWRGMYEAEGRRIKRAINIDMNSVKFCTLEMLENYKKIDLIEEYISLKQEEIEEYNNSIASDTEFPVNGRRQTNIGIFRAYMEAYLKSLNTINQESILMVRQLPPSDKGIPLEVYAFCIHKEWVLYEIAQSNIFDHLIAALPHFELQIYQSPSGGDVSSFISHALHTPDQVQA